ncbi:alpha/beta hydrolase fold protein [Candidatus Magnetomorum sp. HK-1]|nr:alpha/beta hydrolase fold protein [Candidatus Magnetomorum sp. HK-1]
MKELKINKISFIAGRWPLNSSLPTLICIHGSGGSNVLWHFQVEALANTMNTIAIDLPGHGKSDGRGMETIEDYAESVSAFIQEIDAPNPIPCGLSIGGAIVLQLLLQEPANFNAGILVNTGAKLKVMPLIFEMIEKDYKGYVQSMYTFGASEKTDSSKLKPLVESMEKCPPQVALGDFKACDSFNVMDQIHKIKIPVLVLTASDDKLTPKKFGKFLSEQLKKSTLKHIIDAGHLSPLEQPEKVNNELKGFIMEV